MVVEKFADLFSFCHPVQPGLLPQTLSVCLSASLLSITGNHRACFFQPFSLIAIQLKQQGLALVCVLSIFVLVFCVQSNMKFVNLSVVDSQVVHKGCIELFRYFLIIGLCTHEELCLWLLCLSKISIFIILNHYIKIIYFLFFIVVYLCVLSFVAAVTLIWSF